MKLSQLMDLSLKYYDLGSAGTWLGMSVSEDCLYVVLTEVALSKICIVIFFLFCFLSNLCATPCHLG